MGREVRRVPADWQHPKHWASGIRGPEERYKPLFPGERRATCDPAHKYAGSQVAANGARPGTFPIQKISGRTPDRRRCARSSGDAMRLVMAGRVPAIHRPAAPMSDFVALPQPHLVGRTR